VSALPCLYAFDSQRSFTFENATWEGKGGVISATIVQLSATSNVVRLLDWVVDETLLERRCALFVHLRSILAYEIDLDSTKYQHSVVLV